MDNRRKVSNHREKIDPKSKFSLNSSQQSEEFSALDLNLLMVIVEAMETDEYVEGGYLDDENVV